MAGRFSFMSSDAIIHVTDASFAADVLNSDVPVLVDFWAPWCGPCKMIAPVLDELAGQYAGKIKIAKVNVDDHKETPAKFNIRGIPTLIIFKGGNVEATKVGALSRTQLVDFIDSVV
ncbi:thioredoxin TrxA [Cellvibrio polysaccharolyticus]